MHHCRLRRIKARLRWAGKMAASSLISDLILTLGPR
jgi:hypothetical protein